MLSESRQSIRGIPFDEIFKRNLAYYNSLYESMNQSCIVNDVLSWDSDNLRQFHSQYTGPERQVLEEDFKDNLELVFTLVQRQIRKKRIKI